MTSGITASGSIQRDEAEDRRTHPPPPEAEGGGDDATTRTRRAGGVPLPRWDALLSGALGATASCLAKVALDPDSVAPSLVRAACESAVGASSADDPWWSWCSAASLVPRGIALLLMVATNALMLGAFLDGMDESGSIAATALSSAANFSVSALYGILLFGEAVTPRWAFGFSLVLAGVWMLSGVRPNKKTD